VSRTSRLQALRNEHAALLPRVDALCKTADRVGTIATSTLRARLDEDYAFLANVLLPHARAEDDVLYPAVADLMGSPLATTTMSVDHTEIAELVGELGGLTRILTIEEMSMQTARELRRILYGLHTVIHIHFRKEEQVYLPLLENALNDTAAARLLTRTHKAGHASGH
jgi:iron-sulfur cluster repair protein YtfE (RIC family)